MNTGNPYTHHYSTFPNIKFPFRLVDLSTEPKHIHKIYMLTREVNGTDIHVVRCR